MVGLALAMTLGVAVPSRDAVAEGAGAPARHPGDTVAMATAGPIVVPPAAVVTPASIARGKGGAAEVLKAGALEEGRSIAAALNRELAQIDGLKRYAGGQAYKVNCVMRRSATAQVMVRIGSTSLLEAEQAAARSDNTEATYQLGRLRMLAMKMASEKKDARLCVEDDLSSVQTIQRGLEYSPSLDQIGDPAAGPRPPGTPALPPGAPI